METQAEMLKAKISLYIIKYSGWVQLTIFVSNRHRWQYDNDFILMFFVEFLKSLKLKVVRDSIRNEAESPLAKHSKSQLLNS